MTVVTEESKQTCKESQYLDDSTKTCKYLQIYFGSFDDLIDVYYDPSGSSELRLLSSASAVKKKLIAFSDTEIKVQLDFEDPLKVRPHHNLEVKLHFDAFDTGVGQSNIEIPLVR